MVGRGQEDVSQSLSLLSPAIIAGETSRTVCLVMTSERGRTCCVEEMQNMANKHKSQCIKLLTYIHQPCDLYKSCLLEVLMVMEEQLE